VIPRFTSKWEGPTMTEVIEQMAKNNELDAIYQGLGVDRDLVEGSTAYATSGIALAALRRATATRLTRDVFIKANLEAEMRRHRGKKRIRKKKAKRSLRAKWYAYQFTRLISQRRDYAKIGRAAVSVTPLPDPSKEAP